MDEFIDFIAKLNWFESLDTCLRWLCGAKSWEFTISRNCGWSGQQIETMLRHRGVKIWGRGFTHDTLVFRVDDKQANWAEYLLHQNAIPVLSRSFNPKNRHYAKREHFNENSSSKHKRAGWLESLLASLFD